MYGINLLLLCLLLFIQRNTSIRGMNDLVISIDRIAPPHSHTNSSLGNGFNETLNVNRNPSGSRRSSQSVRSRSISSTKSRSHSDASTSTSKRSTTTSNSLTLTQDTESHSSTVSSSSSSSTTTSRPSRTPGIVVDNHRDLLVSSSKPQATPTEDTDSDDSKTLSPTKTPGIVVDNHRDPLVVSTSEIASTTTLNLVVVPTSSEPERVMTTSEPQPPQASNSVFIAPSPAPSPFSVGSIVESSSLAGPTPTTPSSTNDQNQNQNINESIESNAPFNSIDPSTDAFNVQISFSPTALPTSESKDLMTSTMNSMTFNDNITPTQSPKDPTIPTDTSKVIEQGSSETSTESKNTLGISLGVLFGGLFIICCVYAYFKFKNKKYSNSIFTHSSMSTKKMYIKTENTPMNDPSDACISISDPSPNLFNRNSSDLENDSMNSIVNDSFNISPVQISSPISIEPAVPSAVVVIPRES